MRIDTGTATLGADTVIDDLISEGLIEVSYAERAPGQTGFLETTWLTAAGRAWLDAHDRATS